MNLAEINPLTLPSLPLTNKTELPGVSAVYFVIAGDRIIYVGKSRNISQRWANHHRLKQIKAVYGEAMIAWLECPEENLKYIEQIFIQQLQPELNATPQTLYSKRINVYFAYGEEEAIYAEIAEVAKQEKRSLSQTAKLLVVEGLKARKMRSHPVL